MGFDLIGTHPANPVTHRVVGQTCRAYLASRFADPLTAPATNAAAPGTADGGPVTSVATSGAVGQFDFAGLASAFVAYMVSYQDPTDTSNPADGVSPNTYWLGPLLPVQQTNAETFTQAVNQKANRYITVTGIDASMVGLTLPQAHFKVSGGAGTGGFPASGYFLTQINEPSPPPANYQLVAYTSKNGDGVTFDGCTGGTGTIQAGGVVFPAYVNGPLRRRCRYSLRFKVSTNPDACYVTAVCDSGGVRLLTDAVGIEEWNSAAVYKIFGQLEFDVDPGGAYGIYPFAITAYADIIEAMEVDS